jgi:N-formylglutamate deformylase
MPDPYPFLISIPHGGTSIPGDLSGRIALSSREIAFFSDPATRTIYDYADRVGAKVDTPVSRMAVDLNRNPRDLPPRHPDGVVKTVTTFGTPVWRDGLAPGMPLIHKALLAHFFPFHEELDRCIDGGGVAIGFDCHSMLPTGPERQKDAGMRRPLVCLGNNGDRSGRSRKNSLATCPETWIRHLADAFRKELPDPGAVAINSPFTGGFIINAHYWHRGIPWIQIEVNRSLYEPPGIGPASYIPPGRQQLSDIRSLIWDALAGFWDAAPVTETPGSRHPAGPERR